MATTDELNGYLDELVQESVRATRDYFKEDEELLQFARGHQWQAKLPSHRIPFTANYAGVSMKRLTALITDTKPTIDIKANVDGLSELIDNVLLPAVNANWDEQQYDQKFATGLLPKSMIQGACGMNIGFDPSVGSLGEIVPSIIDRRSLIIDPMVTRASDTDTAEYIGYQSVISLNKLRALFPGDPDTVNPVDAVLPEGSVSAFLDRTHGEGRGLDSPGHVFYRMNRQQSGMEASALPRATIQDFYLNDRRIVRQLPREFQEYLMRTRKGLTINDPVWPRGRRIIRAGSNKTILYDGHNPYIDGKAPICLFAWGQESENPWGASEMKLIKSLQAILNKLGSSIVENAVKMNNNIWIGDRDALEKTEWGKLNDAPGLLVKVKPGRTLRRESAPALPGSVFQMIQWIINMMDLLTGLVDVTQGRRPVGVVSGQALEALQLSAQTLVRLMARNLENFMERVGHRMIARIFQFYSTDRLMHQFTDGKWQSFAFEKQKMLADYLIRVPDGKGGMTVRPFNALTDLGLIRFLVTPGSSMAITHQQKGQLAATLYQLGTVPAVDVNKAVQWPDPEEAFQRANQEKLMMGGMQNGNSKRARMPR